MHADDALDLVRAALVWAKAESVTLLPGQIGLTTPLAEPPIYLDSLEFVAMMTHLEEELGLVADDEHFSPGSMRSVADVVAGVVAWTTADQAS